VLAAIVISLWTFLRRWGGVGLFFLGIIDSSLIPTFGSLDLFTGVLAARHKDLWYYYAAMSTAGSLIGAYSTYRIGQGAGRAGLERRFSAKRLQQVNAAFERWGFGAIFVPAIIPPPFPTTLFFVGAGAFQYPLKRYFAAVLPARALRYAAIGYIGARYGRHFIRFFRHPQRYVGLSLAITALIVIAAIMASIAWKNTQDLKASGQ
jgi:membrane protein YqaA with SNARE-associated domain